MTTIVFGELKDPPMRADRRCFRLECRKPLPPAGVKNNDPFCSINCCRVFYGLPPLSTRKVFDEDEAAE